MYSEEEQQVIAEIDDRFKSINVKIAFWYILSLGISNERFRCIPNKKGVIYEVRFHHIDDAGPNRYALIANRGSVLWYFRRPALEKRQYNFDCIIEDFGSDKVNKPRPTEMTVKIEHLQAAKTLVSKYLF
jgi:hypothetical protein